MNVVIEPEENPAAGEIRRVLEAGARSLGQPETLEIEVELVSPEEIRALNREQRGKDAVTDVLSFPVLDGIRGATLRPQDFPLDVDPETGDLLLGSVVICLERAAEQAEAYGHSLVREIGYLAVHGLLHLLGYDHETEEDKRQMREREEAILGSLSITRQI